MSFLFTATSGASAQDRAAKVRGDRERVEEDGFWIYNDLPRGLELAKESGRPLLVVIRCIPCEACAQLDAQVVARDPAVAKLLEKFVCVRIVNANGLDLSQFQYDYDQSFAAFFMNADRAIYGRYGTRSHETEADRDVSVEGFAQALSAAAKKAGFRKGDVLVELDGRSSRLTESQWMTSLLNAKRPGEHVAVDALRDGRRIHLELPMQ